MISKSAAEDCERPDQRYKQVRWTPNPCPSELDGYKNALDLQRFWFHLGSILADNAGVNALLETMKT
jgi:hypothetical protein